MDLLKGHINCIQPYYIHYIPTWALTIHRKQIRSKNRLSRITWWLYPEKLVPTLVTYNRAELPSLAFEPSFRAELSSRAWARYNPTYKNPMTHQTLFGHLDIWLSLFEVFVATFNFLECKNAQISSAKSVHDSLSQSLWTVKAKWLKWIWGFPCVRPSLSVSTVLTAPFLARNGRSHCAAAHCNNNNSRVLFTENKNTPSLFCQINQEKREYFGFF